MQGMSKTASDQQQPCKAVCLSKHTGWGSEIRYHNGCASMQAHRRLVLLVDFLAMDPFDPDESVRYDGGASVKQASHAAFA
jgi:hypothetical protein